MSPHESSSNYDIVFIGSGISCTAVLLSLLTKIQSDSFQAKPVTIAVIEKEKEFWTGLPYGNRSSSNSLTITTLGEFVPTGEKEKFYKWLNENKREWIQHYKKNGGYTAEKWLENNGEQLEAGNWDDIYVPRHLFGNYLNQKVVKLISDSVRANSVKINLINGEAVDVSEKNEEYRIQINNNKGQSEYIVAKKIILSIGSPPVKSINNLSDSDHKYVYINDTYSPSLNENIKSIYSSLSSDIPFDERNILLLGSNASSLELLYLINTNKAIRSRINKITVLSYSGKLPNRITPGNLQSYNFEGLAQLKEKKNFNSAVLIETIEKDLQIAYDNGIRVGDMYYQLSDLVVELLNELNDSQKEIFYCAYGMRFSRLIRRSGAEYSDAASELEKDGKLEFLKGSFINLEKSEVQKDSVRAIYSNSENEICASVFSFPIVVNCGGFEDLNFSSSKLITNIINKGYCSINCTNKGFDVNEDFEASKNFHVMGPLLGGIFNNKARLWHVENAKSIFNLANLLVQVIANFLLVELSVSFFFKQGF
ncbi:MAG: FAD/NAD(P)-binding protein [Chitinophagaceae bacterium]